MYVSKKLWGEAFSASGTQWISNTNLLEIIVGFVFNLLLKLS